MECDLGAGRFGTGPAGQGIFPADGGSAKFFVRIGLGLETSKAVRQISLSLARATKTSLTYWLAMPVAEWPDWIAAIEEQMRQA